MSTPKSKIHSSGVHPGTPSTYSNPHLEQEAVAAVLLDGRGDALGVRDGEIVSNLQWKP